MTGRWIWPAMAMASLSMATVPASAAGDARTFAPSGDWALGSDAESCWISRQFGTTEDGVSFRLQTFAPSRSYRVVLRGKPLPQRDSGVLEFDFRFEPDEASISRMGILGKRNGVPVVTFTSTLETSAEAGDPTAINVDAARTAAIREFVIQFSRGRPLALQLGPLTEVVAQLDACSLGLLAGWGLDPAAQQSLTQRVVPIDQARWLAPGTYPYEYLRNSRSLMVNLRMLVDAQGTPTECVVQAPRTETGSEQLACREIMKTARFEPARDVAGNPVPSYYATTIFYYTRRWNGPINRGGNMPGGQ